MDIAAVLQAHYGTRTDDITLLREGGSVSYAISDGTQRCFLKVIRPPFIDTALPSLDIQLFLAKNGFPMISPLPAKSGAYSVFDEAENALFVLFPFVPGGEPAPEDTAQVGALVGQLHALMAQYPAPLIARDRHFFVERYLEILRRKQYRKADSFAAHGDMLWERVKNLPRGYCHGDLYCGNLHKTPDGQLYVLDFDSSCHAFPQHDIALFCNGTDYFNLQTDGREKTDRCLREFLRGYKQHRSLTPADIASIHDWISLYHFQLQATIIDLHGDDCVDAAFFDRQLDWLIQWESSR